MRDDQRYFLLIGLVFILERIFGLPLVPVAVLTLAIWTTSSRFWPLVGFLGLLNDLFSGFPLGSWSLGFLIPIGVIIAIFRVSRFRPHPIPLALLGFIETLVGSSLQNWLVIGTWAVSSRPMLVLELGWSFLFVFVFKFVRGSFWEEELVVRY
jgi:hypothetical protein